MAQICENVYKKYDVGRYPDKQQEIAKHLLKLRIPFKEDHLVGGAYRADFKIINQQVRGERDAGVTAACRW